MGGHREYEGHFRQRVEPNVCLGKGTTGFKNGEVHGRLHTKLEPSLWVCIDILLMTEILSVSFEINSTNVLGAILCSCYLPWRRVCEGQKIREKCGNPTLFGAPFSCSVRRGSVSHRNLDFVAFTVWLVPNCKCYERWIWQRPSYCWMQRTLLSLCLILLLWPLTSLWLSPPLPSVK